MSLIDDEQARKCNDDLFRWYVHWSERFEPETIIGFLESFKIAVLIKGMENPIQKAKETEKQP